MKGNVHIFIACFLSMQFLNLNDLLAQNLVPNPSFETFTSCPTGNSQIQLAAPWQRPSGSITSPDYCNSCYAQVGVACSNVGVPSNFGGSSNAAHTGQGYVGVFTHYTSCSNCREYVQVPLSAPLVAGQTYSIGFWALRADFSRYASDHLDLYVSSSPPSQSSNQPIQGVIPHVLSNVLIDKNNWTLVSGTFTANGGERWITIGNFNNTSSTNIQDDGSQGGSCALVTAGAYYFIDDVFVQEITILDNELLSFEVEHFNSEQSLVSWMLDDMESIQSLTIQYSNDGVSFDDVFTTDDVSVTSWIDDRQLTGNAYFRMKVVDEEHQVLYTDVKVISFDKPTNQTHIRVFPNPNNGHFQVHLAEEYADRLSSMTLYNALWQPIQQIQAQDSGSTIRISSTGLPSGIYFLQIDCQGSVFTTKVQIEE